MGSLISVIVPVYNTENYLERCVLSVLDQSYQNIQIVLVDDGSTDSSGIICEKLSDLYANVSVVHQENKGLAQARKIGTSISEGEYIMWVDSDDYIESTYIQNMINILESADVDAVVSDLYCEIGDKRTVIKNAFDEGVYSLKDILENLIYTGSFFEYGIQPHGVTKIFRRKELYKIQEKLPAGLGIGEDAAVCYPYISECKKIAVSRICGYHYIQNQSSFTKSRRADEINSINLLCEYLCDILPNEECIKNQLLQYKKYLITMRDFSFWDKIDLFFPYGKIGKNERLIIYGAGVLGQELIRYCVKHSIDMVAWLDSNADYYKANGLEVTTADQFDFASSEWDYILIAVTSEKTADQIKKMLLEMSLPENKIRWFSEQFLRDNSVIYI